VVYPEAAPQAPAEPDLAQTSPLAIVPPDKVLPVSKSVKIPALTPAPAPAPVPPADAKSKEGGPKDEGDPKQDLRIARTKMDARLYDQALTNLHSLVQKYPSSDEALDAYFLTATIQERQERIDDAMATYLEIADRYKGQPRAAEALYAVAGLAGRSKRPDRFAEARRLLTSAAEQYADSPWAARALLARADVEKHEKMHEWDPVLGKSVPSALISYRLLMMHHAGAAEESVALENLAALYDDLKCYDLEAQSLEELARKHPEAAGEKWFNAGELYRRRLNDVTRARAAYSQVGPESTLFAGAQKQLKALGSAR
jgi:tetratricopeptide (TPR) repeat protein